MNISTSFSPAIARTRLASMAQPQKEVSESNLPSDSVTLSGEGADSPSMLIYMGKGALYGGLAGLILPGVIVPLVGFAASPITAPIGAVLGAIAGASAFGHPDYKPA
jgi:hypothetical protein